MTDTQKILCLFLVVFFGWILYLLSPVITPFLLAALLAYLGDPLADKLEEKMSRTLAVTIVFIGMIVIVVLGLLVLVPLIQKQSIIFVERLPSILQWLETTFIPFILSYLPVQADEVSLNTLKPILMEHWQKVGNVFSSIVKTVSHSGVAFIGFIANIVLVPVVTFYLLRDWDTLIGRCRELLPKKVEQKVVEITKNSDEVLGAFLRGQLLVMFVLGIIYALGLAIVGLDFALLIGLIAGLASIVPYLGFIVGIVIASVATLFQFQEWLPLIAVVGVFTVGQLVEGMLLTPLLVGDKIGLHPVAVIFAILAGGQLFGFMGVLLALPVAAVIMVILRHAHKQYVSSSIYSES